MLGNGAIAMFMDSNMIGVGYGGFSENFIRYFSTQETVGVVEPHNIFYTILAELGIIGFIIFIVIIVKLLMDISHVVKNSTNFNRHLAVALLGSFTSYLIFYQFYGGALYDAYVYLIIALVLIIKNQINNDEMKTVVFKIPNSIS
jgi:O-antigen ligase